jgi:hypothetical protein
MNFTSAKFNREKFLVIFPGVVHEALWEATSMEEEEKKNI